MEKLPQSIRKRIKSLSSGKGRRAENAFFTERTKNVIDLLDGPFDLRWIVGTAEWWQNHTNLRLPPSKCFTANTADFERMTSMKTPAEVIAVFELPEAETLPTLKDDRLYIALDGIQDPGNLGTIVRIADWFGIEYIFASRDTVDIYNPKSIISTMGSIKRVKVIYCDMDGILNNASRKGITVWGTTMDAPSLYQSLDSRKPYGIIVVGNEGNGISQSVWKSVSERISIPSFPSNKETAESLNVAMATAIIVSEFRRRSE